jgi:hypothetical protein
MRIDSSGNVLVGKTSSSLGTAGHEIFHNGVQWLTASNSRPLLLNRLSTDGTIQEFRKDGTVVGSIGTGGSGGLYIHSPYGSDSGIVFASEIVAPCTSTGAFEDGVQNLGYSTARWKDLYLSGTVNASLGYFSNQEQMI